MKLLSIKEALDLQDQQLITEQQRTIILKLVERIPMVTPEVYIDDDTIHIWWGSYLMIDIGS